MAEVKNDPNRNAYTEPATDPFSTMNGSVGGGFSEAGKSGGLASASGTATSAASEVPEEEQTLLQKMGKSTSDTIASTGASGFDLDALKEEKDSNNENWLAFRDQYSLGLDENGEFGSLNIEETAGLMNSEDAIMNPADPSQSFFDNIDAASSVAGLDDAEMAADSAGGISSSGTSSLDGIFSSSTTGTSSGGTAV